MPKKKKAVQIDPRDGRPDGLTLGDFLTVQLKVSSTNVEQATSCLNNEDKEVGSNSDAAFDSCKGEKLLSISIDDPKEESRYFICRTKKGGIPVKVESRSSGKKVTLIEHVRGDGKLLVQDLKMKLGTGGLYRDETVELQGDMKVKVTKYLSEKKDLLRPYGTK